MLGLLKREKSLLVCSVLLLLHIPLGVFFIILGSNSVGDSIYVYMLPLTIAVVVFVFLLALVFNTINRFVFKKGGSCSLFKGSVAIWLPSFIFYALAFTWVALS